MGAASFTPFIASESPSTSQRFALGVHAHRPFLLASGKKSRRVRLPRRCKDARVYGHTTTAMHKLTTPAPRPPSPHGLPPSVLCVPQEEAKAAAAAAAKKGGGDASSSPPEVENPQQAVSIRGMVGPRHGGLSVERAAPKLSEVSLLYFFLL